LATETFDFGDRQTSDSTLSQSFPNLFELEWFDDGGYLFHDTFLQ
jgi:hypothetical protein